MTLPLLRPTWAEINLNALRTNLQKIRTQVGPDVKILQLLKANAYGHGAIELGRYCEKYALCQFFGVASVEEGIELRQAGITLPVLVLGSIYPFEAFEEAIKHRLTVTVASMDAAKVVAHIAEKLGQKAFCHVKQDTGMGRIGTRRGGVFPILDFLDKNPHVILDGLYSHLSCADSDPAYTEEQIGYFRDTLTNVRLHGLHINLCHLSATPGLLHRPDSYLDMVRPGHAEFGLQDGFEPVMALKTRVVYVKDVPAGSSISYNRSFKADAPLKVATVPLGYGDGYLRALSNKAYMLVNGKRCRVLGNVTMDMTMIDITNAGPVSVGAEVVAVGRQGTEEIRFKDLAALAGTIDYELCTLVMPRVPRIYKD